MSSSAARTMMTLTTVLPVVALCAALAGAQTVRVAPTIVDMVDDCGGNVPVITSATFAPCIVA